MPAQAAGASATRDSHTRRVRALHWFRGDLRLADNTALATAAARAGELGFVFVLDERRRMALMRFEEARRAAALE